MDSTQITEWVGADTDSSETELRQAVHTVLYAIASSRSLQQNMVIKGGVLLAVQYGNTRYTRDIDFSTDQQYADFDAGAFFDELESCLADAVEALDYGLDCQIQSSRVKPKADATFPTLHVKVGYAYFGSGKHQRLVKKQCPDTLMLDYSFNEPSVEIDELDIIECGLLRAYSLPDLVAEKYRSMIQQPVRNRIRRQDVFDLHTLLTTYNAILVSPDVCKQVYETLQVKSEIKGLDVGSLSLADPGVVSRSQKEYGQLEHEVTGELPDFDAAYALVQGYYEALPWSED